MAELKTTEVCPKCNHLAHPEGQCATPSTYGCRECGPRYVDCVPCEGQGVVLDVPNTGRPEEKDYLSINKDTGVWVEGGSIVGEQGAIIASAVLPGTTPELIKKWYDDFMDEDAYLPAGITVHVTHVQVGVNMGDHAQDVTHGVNVDKYTRVEALVASLLTDTPPSKLYRRDKMDDYLIVRLAKPLKEAAEDLRL